MLNSQQRERLGGDFFALLIHDRDRLDEDNFAVLVGFEPIGDEASWRLAQPFPCAELGGRPLVAEHAWSGVEGIAEWEPQRAARMRLNKLVSDAGGVESIARELIGYPQGD